MSAAFREVVVVDFEFVSTTGNQPEPVCLAAYELRSERRFRVFQGEFGPAPPYATGPDVLFVAFYASADLGCYRVLGWPMPERILDLYVEFRNLTNGLQTPSGWGLLGALVYFGVDAMNAVEKKELQQAIGDGTWPGRYTPEVIKASASRTLTRWLACFRSCCPGSIFLERCCGVATCQRQPP
jgi:DNA polymerase I